jgi:hypothetical protein
MDGDDIEFRLESVKGMLDQLTKELQHLIQSETDKTPEGEEPDLAEIERCISRTGAITMMVNSIMHDFSVVKLNVATLHDMLGCGSEVPGAGKKKKKPKPQL